MLRQPLIKETLLAHLIKLMKLFKLLIRGQKLADSYQLSQRFQLKINNNITKEKIPLLSLCKFLIHLEARLFKEQTSFQITSRSLSSKLLSSHRNQINLDIGWWALPIKMRLSICKKIEPKEASRFRLISSKKEAWPLVKLVRLQVLSSIKCLTIEESLMLNQVQKRSSLDWYQQSALLHLHPKNYKVPWMRPHLMT